MFDLNNEVKPKCRHCGKIYGNHKSKTLACPTGTKGSIGYTSYHDEKTYEPKQSKKKTDELAINREHNSFVRGYACAAAFYAKWSGRPSEAVEIINQSGFNLNDLKKAGVEKCDIDAIYGRTK